MSAEAPSTMDGPQPTPPDEFSHVETAFFATGVELEQAALAETDAMLEGPAERAAYGTGQRRFSGMSSNERLILLSAMAAVIALIAGLSFKHREAKAHSSAPVVATSVTGETPTR